MQVATKVVIMLLAALGCSGEDERASRFQVPPPSGPAPHPEVQNAAPLNNAEGYPEQARNTMPDDDERERSATAQLEAVGTASVRGEAELSELADQVKLELSVQNGRPGVSRVTLEGLGCRDLRAKSAQSSYAGRRAEERDAGLGKVKIGQDGEGRFATTLPRANLMHDTHGTLLGKSLVLWRAERMVGAAGALERPVACAEIKQS